MRRRGSRLLFAPSLPCENAPAFRLLRSWSLPTHAATLRKHALSDPLTGLYNRRAFFEALEARLARARSADRDRFAVAVLNLDSMKEINDTLGHLAGDETLKVAAEAIRRSIRDTEVACRYGGDEFAVLFTGKGPSAATLSLRLAVNIEELLASGRAFHISFAVGVAYYPEDGTTADALLAVADYWMYEQKRRTCVRPRLCNI